MTSKSLANRDVVVAGDPMERSVIRVTDVFLGFNFLAGVGGGRCDFDSTLAVELVVG